MRKKRASGMRVFLFLVLVLSRPGLVYSTVGEDEDAFQVVTGTIVSVSEASVTILADNGDHMSFSVAEGTIIYLDDKQSDISALKEGYSVDVEYTAPDEPASWIDAYSKE